MAVLLTSKTKKSRRVVESRPVCLDLKAGFPLQAYRTETYQKRC